MGKVHRHMGDTPWMFLASDEVENHSPHTFSYSSACDDIRVVT